MTTLAAGNGGPPQHVVAMIEALRGAQRVLLR